MPLFPDFERVYLNGEAPPEPSARWILLHHRAFVVRSEGRQSSFPEGESPDAILDKTLSPLLLGRLDGIDYWAAELPDEATLEQGWEAIDLRSLYGRISETEWFIAGYASQVLYWHRTSGYCPVCGGPAGPVGAEWRRQCTNCGHERYPMVSPAVLALVHDGADRILLAHKPGWGARRSILAGFVLPGESLEECVHREVLEESGVRVTDVAYFNSQPWPFPHQLMIGFTSRFVSGEIVIDAEELEGAEWYDFRSLPPLPPPLSLSRRMIDAWAQARAALG